MSGVLIMGGVMPLHFLIIVADCSKTKVIFTSNGPFIGGADHKLRISHPMILFAGPCGTKTRPPASRARL